MLRLCLLALSLVIHHVVQLLMTSIRRFSACLLFPSVQQAAVCGKQGCIQIFSLLGAFLLTDIHAESGLSEGCKFAHGIAASSLLS